MAEREFSGEYGERVKVETENVKCPGCGANMIFDPELQMLYCPHCGSKKELANVSTAHEIDLTEGLSADAVWKPEETVVFRCDNCGAKVVLQKDETARRTFKKPTNLRGLNLMPFCRLLSGGTRRWNTASLGQNPVFLHRVNSKRT